MKTMKGLSMNKMLGSIKRKPGPRPGENGTSGDASSIDPSAPGETPETIVARCVKAFCESGRGNDSGNEVTFLPPIVDAAESSPAAAAEAARLIRKYLHRDYWSKPAYQYNSVMLMRILADNPGPLFTRNFDKKFVETCKEVLRSTRDASVRQILMETLDTFEMQKQYDEGCTLLVEMWKKEKEKAYKAYGGRPVQPPTQATAFNENAPIRDPHSQNYFSRSHRSTRLPNPVELADRLEEARTSSKLLEQLVSCTPPAEILSNELIREFADRCLSASRSLQGYMTSNDPAPDNDTMESLIDTNEQLQTALSQHQRAVLNARKQLGLGERSGNTTPANAAAAVADPPPGPPPNWQNPTATGSSSRSNLNPTPPPREQRLPTPPSGKGKGPAGWEPSPFHAGPSRSANGTPSNAGYLGNGRHSEEGDNEDPFRDPTPEPAARAGGASSGSNTWRLGGSTSGGEPAPAPPKLAIGSSRPGFGTAGPTESYLGRQDSAIGKVQMHGAAAAGGDIVSPVNEGASTLPSAGAFGTAHTESSRRYDVDDDDDDDRYDATPKKEGQFRF